MRSTFAMNERRTVTARNIVIFSIVTGCMFSCNKKMTQTATTTINNNQQQSNQMHDQMCKQIDKTNARNLQTMS